MVIVSPVELLTIMCGLSDQIVALQNLLNQNIEIRNNCQTLAILRHGLENEIRYKTFLQLEDSVK
jgi:hypothetical protein